MAGPSKSDRLSPPLMFAFREAHRAKDAKKKLDVRDETGTRVIAGRRSLKASVTERQLRAQLSRDLDILMNTVNLGSAVDLGGLAHVEQSVVNFGLPEISNRTIDENANSDIVGEIRTALLNFEPRLLRKTVRVSRDGSVDIATLNVRFLVSAEMACDPIAVPVEFVADLEISSGKLTISRQ